MCVIENYFFYFAQKVCLTVQMMIATLMHNIFLAEMRFQSNLNVIDKYKLVVKKRIKARQTSHLSLFPNLFNNSIKHEHLCKILYAYMRGSISIQRVKNLYDRDLLFHILI